MSWIECILSKSLNWMPRNYRDTNCPDKNGWFNGYHMLGNQPKQTKNQQHQPTTCKKSIQIIKQTNQGNQTNQRYQTNQGNQRNQKQTTKQAKKTKQKNNQQMLQHKAKTTHTKTKKNPPNQPLCSPLPTEPFLHSNEGHGSPPVANAPRTADTVHIGGDLLFSLRSLSLVLWSCWVGVACSTFFELRLSWVSGGSLVS